MLHSTTLSITVTDSLAILEFLADQNPHLPLWPRDPALRALARSATAEMHSGFPTLRNTFHTNFVARYEGLIPGSGSAGAKKEIKRVLRIWDDARRVTVERLGAGIVGEHPSAGEDEGFLFGGFSIADAFYWPVLWVCIPFIIIFVFSLVDVYSAFAFGGESRIFAGVVCTDDDPALSHVQSAARRGESGRAEVDGEDVE